MDLSDDLTSILKAHIRKSGRVFRMEPTDLLFQSRAGTPLDGANLRERVWKRTLMRTGMHYRSLYQTRHTFASIMLMKNNPVIYVAQQLGHANAHTTLTYYAKYIPGMMATAPVALGMSRKEADMISEVGT